MIVNPAGFTVIFCFLLTLGWMFWKRRSLQRVGESSSSRILSISSGDLHDVVSVVADSAARYEQMERIRQRQQQEYEERTRRRLEEKQAVSKANFNDLFMKKFYFLCRDSTQ